jgi:uncharacterized membrane protein
METARASVVIALPMGETQRRWIEFTGGGREEAGSVGGMEVPADKLPNEVEKGKTYFEAEGDDSTRVTMELYYNPSAVREASLTDEWVSLRIGLYLERFKGQI